MGKKNKNNNQKNPTQINKDSKGLDEKSVAVARPLNEVITENEKQPDPATEMNKKREALQKEVSALEQNLEKKKKELETQENEKEDKINALSRDYPADGEKTFSKMKGALEAQAGKNQREKNPAQAEKADALLEEIGKFNSINISVNKIEADIKKIKNYIRTKQADIESKNKEKTKSQGASGEKGSVLNNVLPSQKTGGASDRKTKLSVPSLDRLPNVGTLYEDGGKSYLAIKDWDDFDGGQQEAERLKAALCAQRSN